MCHPCYISAVTNPDPTEQSFWRPLRLLQSQLDDDITRLYAQRGLTGIRPRFAYPMIRLAHQGPMTIGDLAQSLDLTHSAVSQTVTAMRTQGLVRTVPGPDARTRVVETTTRGRDLVPFLEAEWRATEEALTALDADLPVQLSRYVEEVTARLARHSFTERILDRLNDPADPGEGST